MNLVCAHNTCDLGGVICRLSKKFCDIVEKLTGIYEKWELQGFEQAVEILAAGTPISDDADKYSRWKDPQCVERTVITKRCSPPFGLKNSFRPTIPSRLLKYPSAGRIPAFACV
jgi:hypothetical protein